MSLIDNRSIKRATRAFRCLPLNHSFYKDIQTKGLNAEEVFEKTREYKLENSKWFKSSASLEDCFCWLILIGILRREVDGQGLTSKVRITPLGRQILLKNPNLLEKKAGIIEQIINFSYRKWPLI